MLYPICEAVSAAISYERGGKSRLACCKPLESTFEGARANLLPLWPLFQQDELRNLPRTPCTAARELAARETPPPQIEAEPLCSHKRCVRPRRSRGRSVRPMTPGNESRCSRGRGRKTMTPRRASPRPSDKNYKASRPPTSQKQQTSRHERRGARPRMS